MTRTSALTVLGELLLTAGLVVLLFAGYLVWGTGWDTARAQAQLSDTLDTEWGGNPNGGAVRSATPDAAPAPGRPFLRIYVPAFGAGFRRTVLEGVGQPTLGAGPGHYPGSALPGQPGNVAIAGHRVGHGAPFDAAGDLGSCDAVVLETRDAWFVYRMLPMADERAEWSSLVAERSHCRGVAPLGGPYADTSGAEIVTPQQSDVIAPVPHRPGATPTASLLTLTTCHPRFSARKRLVLHAVQVAAYDKRGRDAGWRPPELTEV